VKMTGPEKRARMADVQAACENFREVLLRAVPRGFERRIVLFELRQVQAKAKSTIWRAR
jgi:hypothetical protein